MITDVDTNVLIDILNNDERHFENSDRLLQKALNKGSLIINEVVYAELASQFDGGKRLDEFLEDVGINLESSTPKALREASKAWKNYVTKGSRELECPSCGARTLVRCENCSNLIALRQHIISDFLIGGHAMVLSDALLTRDRGYYRAYFKDLTLFA